MAARLKPAILLVHGRRDTGRRLSAAARGFGYRLRAVTDPEALGPMLAEVKPQILVIADEHRDLPASALAAQARRAVGTACFIVVVVERNAGESAVLRAFESGADDVVAAPLRVDVMAARLRALIRRLSPAAQAKAIHDSAAEARRLELDVAAHQARVGGRSIALTLSEYKVLAVLVRRAGRTVSRQELLGVLWNTRERVRTRSVDVHVSNLRRKLSRSSCRILSSRPLGYRFSLA